MDATSYYGFFSIVILPINSVINPFLYSEIMCNLFTKVLAVLARFVRYFLALLKLGEVNQTHNENQQAIELKTVNRVKERRPSCSQD